MTCPDDCRCRQLAAEIEQADGYDAGHADGFAEGRRESDVTGHLLRPHARHLLDEVLEGWSSCERCAAIRAVLEDLLP